MDEMETEEERERKRRERINALAYLYYEQEQKERAAEEKAEKAEDEQFAAYLARDLQSLREEAVDDVNSIALSMEILSESFSMSDDDEDAEEVHTTLKSLNLEKKDFSSIALASTAKNNDNFKKVAEGICRGERPSEETREVREGAVYDTKSALIAYKNGDCVPLGIILANGVRSACVGFASAVEKRDIVKWSCLIRDIMPALEKDPRILEASGLSRDEIDAANGAVQIGACVERGIQALDIMTEQMVKNGKVTDSVFSECAGHVTAMEMVLYRRSEDFKKWQVEMGRRGGTATEIRNGLISKSDFQLLSDISKTAAMNKLRKTKRLNAIKQLADPNGRKTVMRSVLRDMSFSRDASISAPSGRQNGIDPREIQPIIPVIRK